jgi:acyl carrier protein
MNNDISARVSRCFLNVFPDVTAADLPRASQASLPQWDSTAHVTLLSAIAEEFRIDLDDESFEVLTSYPLVLGFVESQVAAR